MRRMERIYRRRVYERSGMEPVDLAFVREDAALEVRVVVEHAGIQHRDERIRVAEHEQCGRQGRPSQLAKRARHRFLPCWITAGMWSRSWLGLPSRRTRTFDVR